MMMVIVMRLYSSCPARAALILWVLFGSALQFAPRGCKHKGCEELARSVSLTDLSEGLSEGAYRDILKE